MSSRFLSFLLGENVNSYDQQFDTSNQDATAQLYESMAPFSLGTNQTKANKKRTRKEIFTKWERMLRFAPIAEGMGIHVSAALGGDSYSGQQVFITPAQRLKKANGPAAEKIKKQLDERRDVMEKLINKYLSKLARDAISFGDSYARIYGKKENGVIDLLCNEYTYPPLIQPFEQGSKTVAFYCLDPRNWQKTITKLNTIQMVRFKMPRMSNIAQYELVETGLVTKMLEGDDPDELPILPAHLGGSFLYEIEEVYDDVILALASMNSQQIADTVNQMFLTINMSGMPPAQRQAYVRALEGLLKNHETYVRDALSGGEAVWNTAFHMLPVFDEKQVLNPVGDIKAQRSSPINIEQFMINVRLLMGGIGLDPSMVGWADMLTGGIGEGGAFHTSAQIMRRSQDIRTAVTEGINQILHLDWGFAFNEQFEPKDYPWQVEYYTNQTAAATEEISNAQSRMNTTLLKTQVITALKETNLDVETMAYILERDAGMKYDEAQLLAESIFKSRKFSEDEE
ncbi:hypothetical protein KWF73_04730 [Acinetobacter pittii]|uniref:hypothetical protein n=1 Tax=Acinetobacter pittii TaxID=48296 RepID=UPI00355B240D